MIAIDTSAVLAILLRESQGPACSKALAAEDAVVISAGTVAEVLIVAGGRGIAKHAADLIDQLGFEVVPVTEASAKRVAEAYLRWGKGMHPASLNFGDCFAYEVAKESRCRLLYVGGDFSKTDIEGAL
jgi:ribonuclease VapC